MTWLWFIVGGRDYNIALQERGAMTLPVQLGMHQIDFVSTDTDSHT